MAIVIHTHTHTAIAEKLLQTQNSIIGHNLSRTRPTIWQYIIIMWKYHSILIVDDNHSEFKHDYQRVMNPDVLVWWCHVMMVWDD